MAALTRSAWGGVARARGGCRARLLWLIANGNRRAREAGAVVRAAFRFVTFWGEVAEEKAEAAARAAAIANSYRDAKRGNCAFARSLLVLCNGPRLGCGLRP